MWYSSPEVALSAVYLTRQDFIDAGRPEIIRKITSFIPTKEKYKDFE